MCFILLYIQSVSVCISALLANNKRVHKLHAGPIGLHTYNGITTATITTV